LIGAFPAQGHALNDSHQRTELDDIYRRKPFVVGHDVHSFSNTFSIMRENMFIYIFLKGEGSPDH